eukprot:CAMPEP_0181304978 /NCGR_PEP_ID=MMETSP1101-20121128/9464_1 /TAXON_ID=46948 /ORGANISM="Rhodomonas abbreviata, Strain Caron Lab Isolate" /LENGTH=165 /DNA_ID=CAMNT_0023410823 /DNA_START=167 /DNA_END=661 /DNA_ORIENTATION=-
MMYFHTGLPNVIGFLGEWKEFSGHDGPGHMSRFTSAFSASPVLDQSCCCAVFNTLSVSPPPAADAVAVAAAAVAAAGPPPQLLLDATPAFCKMREASLFAPTVPALFALPCPSSIATLAGKNKSSAPPWMIFQLVKEPTTGCWRREEPRLRLLEAPASVSDTVST